MNASRPATAILALVSGLLTIAVGVLSVPPPADVAQLVAFVDGRRTAIALYASLTLVWSLATASFVIYLGRFLGSTMSALLATAQLLVVAGVLLLGFVSFASVGAMLALVSAGPTPGTEIAAFQFKFWSHLGFYLSDPGLMSWGLGMLLFARHSWQDHAIPKAVTVLGALAGVAGALTLLVYQTPVLALAQLLFFALWSLAIGVTLLRARAVVG